MNSNILTFKSRLISKIKISTDIHRFIFKKPKNFKYFPGQYVKIILNIKNPDNRGVSRYFTLFSSPTENNIAITTRIIKSSFKKKLESLLIGDEVRIRGPWGSMTWNDRDARPIIYIAKGVGITPARSMLIYLHDMNLYVPFTLLSFFDLKEDLKILEDLKKTKNKLRKLIVCVGNKNLKNYDAKIKETINEYANPRILISGSPIFVEFMIKKIKKLGIKEKDIEYEDFSGYKS